LRDKGQLLLIEDGEPVSPQTLRLQGPGGAKNVLTANAFWFRKIITKHGKRLPKEEIEPGEANTRRGRPGGRPFRVVGRRAE